MLVDLTKLKTFYFPNLLMTLYVIIQKLEIIPICQIISAVVRINTYSKTFMNFGLPSLLQSWKIDSENFTHFSFLPNFACYILLTDMKKSSNGLGDAYSYLNIGESKNEVWV